MAPALRNLFTGPGLAARAMRSGALTVAGFGWSQVIRLASNLLLTRLLFPEAFGTMALISVLLQGLFQFSDVGITPAIMQSKRGDDRDFLDTAWTIQVLRGFGLWLTACLLAWPMAWFYGTPHLTQLLPVAALTLVIGGFTPTRLDSAGRHLNLGRVTAIDVVTQIVGIVTAVALAWAWGNVWALVVSGILGALAQLALYTAYLPGTRNRFRWEGPAAQELVGFGKWIFLSTLCGFLFYQGDKILLGKYLELDLFGIYNIGYFLAAFPMLLGGMVTRRLLIPIYRELPPGASAANFAKLRRMRFAVTGGLLGLLAVFSWSGVWLVETMYDPRYLAAGAIVVVIAAMQVPQIVVLTYDQAALAAGDSRSFFVLTLAKAVLMVGGLIVGLELAGLIGALASQGIAMLLVYPVAVWLARRMQAWDPLHDAMAFAAGGVIAALALWINLDAVRALSGLGG